MRLAAILAFVVTGGCNEGAIPTDGLAMPDLLAEAGMATGPPCGNTAGLEAGAPWPMRGYCPTHQGRSPAIGAQTARLRWAFKTGGAVLSSPVIAAEGTVYVGSSDASIYALDGATGKQKWAFQTDYAVVGSAAIGADGTVYAGSSDFKFYAIDGATGRQRWAPSLPT